MVKNLQENQAPHQNPSSTHPRPTILSPPSNPYLPPFPTSNPNNWRSLIGDLPIGEPPSDNTHPLAMVLISDFIPPYTKKERWRHSKIFTFPCYQQDIEKYHWSIPCRKWTYFFSFYFWKSKFAKESEIWYVNVKLQYLSEPAQKILLAGSEIYYHFASTFQISAS